MNKIRNAFSLVELSIVIAIIAIIAGAVMSTSNVKQNIYKIDQTKNKLDLIEKALASFVRINGRLPCPAIITQIPNSSKYGNESCGCESQTTASSNSSFSCATALVTGGMIPFYSLNLPKELAIDAWGNKIQYIVMKAFTANDSSCSYATPSSYQTNQSDGITYNNSVSFDNCNKGLINILGPSSSQRANNSVYVLLSHGPNGYSAYSENSSNPFSDSPSSNIDELVNKNIVSTSYLQKEANNNFDDIVRFKSKWQILQEAGANISNLACIYAKKIITNSDLQSGNNFYCSNQPASADCESTINILSNLVLDRCLNK